LWPQAVEEFSTAINIDGSCMEAWKRRGQSRAAIGQDAEAIVDLTRAAELAPKDADIYHQRGLIYFKLVRKLMLFLGTSSCTLLEATDTGAAQLWSRCGGFPKGHND
jgi:tetratricopeptide (TPR) repeat protein